MTSDTESSGLFARLERPVPRSLVDWQASLEAAHFDDDVYDDLEDQPLMADLVEASTVVVSALRERVRTTRIDSSESLKEALIDELSSILKDPERPLVAQMWR